MSLWDHRLVVVTGKGGVGRTTVATCLGLAAAASGHKAAVVEMHGVGAVAELVGYDEPEYAPRTVASGVDTFSISAEACLEDFGLRRLRSRRLVKLAFHNRVTEAFLDAVPGLPDLLQLGKLRNLLEERRADDPRYDVVILDAPATGHGLTLLGAARSMSEMTRVGPFYEEARLIESMLSDPERTALVLVTLPEELPVNESLEFVDQLADDRGVLAAVVVNQVLPHPLPRDPSWAVVRDRLTELGQDGLVTLGDDTVARDARQSKALSDLVARIPAVAGRPVPLATLPATPTPPMASDLPHLAACLADLGATA